jgi:hypothetical protein
MTYDKDFHSTLFVMADDDIVEMVWSDDECDWVFSKLIEPSVVPFGTDVSCNIESTLEF